VVGAPAHIELQVQSQLAVTERDWAVIAVLVAGTDFYMLPRTPNRELIAAVEAEAEGFLESVAAHVEPPALGEIVELPILRLLYPEVYDEPLMELTGSEAEAMDEWLVARAEAAESRRRADKAYQGLTAHILQVSGAHGRLRTPGHWVRVSKGKGGTRINAKAIEGHDDE
jgi:predicted phage-related endonuclease